MTWNNNVLSKFGRISGSNFSYDTLDKIIYTSIDFSVYRSRDFGKTWEKINGNIPNYKNNNHPYIRYVDYYKGIVFAFTSRDTMYQSFDKGNTWIGIPYDYSLRSALGCTRDLVKYKDKLYLYSANSSYDSVLLSNDYGKSWQVLHGNKYFSPFIASNDGTFFAIQKLKNKTDILCKSYDEGFTWTEIPLPSEAYHTDINFISVSDEGILWMVTNYRLFRTKYPITKVNDNLIENNNYLYPNPATDFVELNIKNHFDNKIIEDEIEIAIYNILGQRVMYDKLQTNSPYLRINIHHLTSGIYFLRLGSNNQMFIKE